MLLLSEFYTVYEIAVVVIRVKNIKYCSISSQRQLLNKPLSKPHCLKKLCGAYISIHV